jgi:hypothetical protein
MNIPSNTEAVKLEVEQKIISKVGPEEYRRTWKELIDSAITKEDLVEPLAKGIEEYRGKKKKIKNIKAIKNRVEDISARIKAIAEQIEKDGNKNNFITEYQRPNSKKEQKETGEAFYKSGDVVFKDDKAMRKISRDLDRIMKELKPLAKYIADEKAEANSRFGNIQFTLISRTTSNTKETFLFDIPLGADMRSLTATGVDIDMVKVPEKAQELWTKLEKQAYANSCNKFLATHLYNYRNMLNQTRKKSKDKPDNSTTLPQQWRAYAAEAFIEHMQNHEGDNYAKFRRMLSGNFKYNTEESMIKDFTQLKDKYGNFKQGMEWRYVSGEHAHLGWIHFVAAQGNLNGMLFGDAGREQVKATSAQYVREVSWENIKRALDFIDFLQDEENNKKSSEELAREILYGKDYAGYFIEKLINRTKETVYNYLDNTTAEIMGIINSSELISRGG